MPCERCDECRRNGERFCRYCGEQISDEYTAKCPGCDMCLAEGMSFCTECGRPLVKKYEVNHTVVVLGIIAAAMLTCLLLFETFVMLWGMPNVLDFLTNYSSGLILITWDIITIWTLSGTGLKIYYILLVAAVLASVIYALYKAYRPVKDLTKGNTKKIQSTALFELCVMFAALYLIEFIIAIIVNPSDSVSFKSKWEEMFQLLEAPVWEEIITRILYLGLPVLIVYSVRKVRDLPAWHYLIGGWNKFDRTTLIFIVFSATMFGLGHIMGSWGAWKFIPTFLFGLIAGYLFVKYGVYATILMHFLTDYISAESYFFGTSSPVLSALLIFGTAILCAPYVWVYAKKGYLCARSVFFGDSKQ